MPVFSRTIGFENDSSTVIVYSLLEKNQIIEITEVYDVLNIQEFKVTVLHPEGLKHAQITIPYDELTTIENFSGSVRDPISGKIAQKLKLRV